MVVKTVSVTNPKNVLVQVPRFIITMWGILENDKLEVFLDEKKLELIIRPTIQA